MIEETSKITPTLADLADLATLAKASAERSMARIDETASVIAASNARVAAMEAQALTAREHRRATAPPTRLP